MFFCKLFSNKKLYLIKVVLFKKLGLNMGGYDLGFTGGYSPVVQYSAKDFENAAKYAVGTTLVNSEEGPFEGMGFMLGITGLTEMPKIVNWFRAAQENGGIGEAFRADLAKIKENFQFSKDLLKDGGWKKPSVLKAIYTNGRQAESTLAVENEIAKQAKAEVRLQEGKISLFDKVKSFITGKKPEEILEDKAKKLNESVNAAKVAETQAISKAAIAKEAIATDSSTFTEAAKDFLSKATKTGEAAKPLEEAAEVVAKGSKFAKFMKGNALFAIISGVGELFTQVIPTFTQLGAGKGINQILKSTAKVGASVGGWAAGAAAGAAIGSIIPGAGTVIGGVVGALLGLAGGCIGSWAATKVTEKIVGKDELEIAKEEQAKELAQEAAKNPQVAQQVMKAAAQRLQTEGTDSADAKAAFGSLTKLANAQVASAKSTAYTPSVAPSVNFSGLSSNPFSSSNSFMDRDLISMYGGIA